MPISLAGMHRSGTSMIMRLLNLCGLYMGPEQDIIRPSRDNPSGFWENSKFLLLNEELLAHLGASWDLPPSADKAAALSSLELPTRITAEHLIRQFEGKEPWGWKDPRNSLTLSFWKSLIPDLKVVMCVRNPIEVYQSLNRRGGSSFLFSISLWLIYNQYVLRTIPSADRIVTHYESYFNDPEAELHRVADFIGMDVAEETISGAGASVSTDMRHNVATTKQLADLGVSPQIVDLYLMLCGEAGPVCQAAVDTQR